MNYHIAAQNGYIEIQVIGEHTIADLIMIYRELRRHPSYLAGMNRLWDFRSATMSNVTVDDLVRLALESAEYSPEDSRVAILVSEDADLDRLRQAGKPVREALTASTRLFQDSAAASEWVEG